MLQARLRSYFRVPLRPERSADFFRCSVKGSWLGFAVLAREIHIPNFINRGEVNVQVRNFQASDHDTHFIAGKGALDTPCYLLRSLKQMGGEVHRGICPCVDFLPWHDKGMAGTDGSDG